MRDAWRGKTFGRRSFIALLGMAVAGGLVGCFSGGVFPEEFLSSAPESAPAATNLSAPAAKVVSVITGDSSVGVHLLATDLANAKFKSLPGATLRLSRVGEPDIPWQVVTLLLPPNADLASLLARTATISFGPITACQDIAPVGPPATWVEGKLHVAWPQDRVFIDGRDVAVYGQDAFWPAAEAKILDTGRLRKWRLVRVAVPAFQYNPIRGEVRPLTDVSLSVDFAHRSAKTAPLSAAEAADSIGQDTVRNLAVNFDSSATDYGVATDDSVGASTVKGYVIITTAAIQNASTQLAAFAAMKRTRGYTVQVVTESQFGGGTGDAAANNIRNWLKSHYISDSIKYVLLIGDPDPSNGDVPMKMLWPRRWATEYTGWRDSPSDFFYSDLTGNWDLDGDGYFGEYADDLGTGGVDRYAEVWVGRIPNYGVIAETDLILAKIINYETQSAAAIQWRKRALLPMKPSDNATPGYQLGEQIKSSILTPKGWSYYRVYEQMYGLTPPPETYPCTYANVTNAWTANPFGMVTWWTHGNSTQASEVMDIAHISSLNDTYPSFTFQCSCLNASPEDSGNLAYSLLKHGAINTVAATRVSWYYVGEASFGGSPSNSGMAYEYTRRLIRDSMTAGQALADLKQTLPVDVSSADEIWMNFTDFNVYGDPETALASIAPQPPQVANVETSACVQRSADIPLPATDDGMPGALTRIITSLPAHGTLQDPGAGPIGAVPYVLTGGGNRVVYSPWGEFEGLDNFTFKANDGGLPPEGGDSATAIVSICVDRRARLLSEGFDTPFVNGVPLNWTREFKTGSLNWLWTVGDYHSDDMPHGGARNAALYSSQAGPHETWLISPAIMISDNLSNPTLEFWHKQVPRSGNQDTLGVYYRIGTSGAWTLLAQYTAEVPVWTREVLALPSIPGTYHLGFLGNATSGFAAVIDDVAVTATVKFPGDANADGIVSFEDFSTLQNHYGHSGGWADGDFDGNGQVNFQDFSILQNHYGQTYP